MKKIKKKCYLISLALFLFLANINFIFSLPQLELSYSFSSDVSDGVLVNDLTSHNKLVLTIENSAGDKISNAHITLSTQYSGVKHTTSDFLEINSGIYEKELLHSMAFYSIGNHAATINITKAGYEPLITETQYTVIDFDNAFAIPPLGWSLDEYLEDTVIVNGVEYTAIGLMNFDGNYTWLILDSNGNAPVYETYIEAAKTATITEKTKTVSVNFFNFIFF